MKKIFKIKNGIFKYILKHFFISLIIIYSIFFYMYFIVSFKVKSLEYWDIEWYMNIMKNGYNEMSTVFFPLLPITMKFFNFFKIPILGTTIFNNILCLLTCILFYKISNEIYESSEKVSLNIILLFLYSPIRLYVSIPYTESLFIFLCTLSFYLYKKRMNPYILGITIGLSVATRNGGAIWFFILFIMLFFDFYKTRKKDKFIYLIKTYIPATIISCLYPIYLQIKFGNWKMFLNAQFEFWGRKNDRNIFNILISDLSLLNNKNLFITTKITVILTYISLIFAIILIIKSLRYNGLKRIELILFLGISLIIYLSTYRVGWNNDILAKTCSFYRYSYGTFPMYLLVSNRTKFKIYFNVNLSILIIVSIFFASPFFLC